MIFFSLIIYNNQRWPLHLVQERQKWTQAAKRTPIKQKSHMIQPA